MSPGSDIKVEFTVRHPLSGATCDADALPTALLIRNGVATEVTVLVFRMALGVYRVTTTIPSDYEIGDTVQIRISLVVAEVPDTMAILREVLVPLVPIVQVEAFTGDAADAIDTLIDQTNDLGDGSVSVDHNYGGEDNLRILNDQGAPVDEAMIRVYLREDWDAGNHDKPFIVASSKTNTDGRWRHPVLVDPDNYTLLIFKQGQYQSKLVNLTIT